MEHVLDPLSIDLVEGHERKYGPAVKASTRARNASYFAELFRRHAVDHFHVHFANRAAHTALFLKAMSGLSFSVTAHGQDFMADLGNDDLLREICDEAEFVAVETEYSRGLMQARCPNAASKIHRVYNGMDLANFLGASPKSSAGMVEILSVGRLVAFSVGAEDYLYNASFDVNGTKTSEKKQHDIRITGGVRVPFLGF